MSRKCQPSGDAALSDLDPDSENGFGFVSMVRMRFLHRQNYKRISPVRLLGHTIAESKLNSG